MKFLAFFLIIFTVVYASETGAFELEEHEVRVFSVELGKFAIILVVLLFLVSKPNSIIQ